MAEVSGKSDRPDPSKPRRRWCQFSLRSLFVFVTVCSLVLGWVYWKLKPGLDQYRAVTAIVRLGGKVVFDYEYDESDPANGGDGERPGHPWLKMVLPPEAFGRVVKVDLAYSAATDDSLIGNRLHPGKQ